MTIEVGDLVRFRDRLVVVKAFIHDNDFCIVERHLPNCICTKLVSVDEIELIAKLGQSFNEGDDVYTLLGEGSIVGVYYINHENTYAVKLNRDPNTSEVCFCNEGSLWKK